MYNGKTTGFKAYAVKGRYIEDVTSQPWIFMSGRQNGKSMMNRLYMEWVLSKEYYGR